MTLIAAAARRRLPDDSGMDYPLPPKINVLVDVTTYDGSGNLTHPSVVDMGPAGWNGYRWWFADTPYPPEDGYLLENPSVWASNTRTSWEIPTGLTNPIDPTPIDGYSSDTEIVWNPDENKMLVYWREVFSDPTRFDFCVAESTNGSTWTVHPETVLTLPSGVVNFSPAICRISASEWRMWLWKDFTPPEMYASDSPFGPFEFVSATTLIKGSPTAADTPRIRHGSVKWHDGMWWGLGGSVPMVSADGVTWHYGPDIGFAAYRATFTPSTLDGYMDVWYSNTFRTRYRRDPFSRWTNLIP